MSESIWKKEIRLRKPKQPKAEAAAVTKVEETPAPKAKPESFWRKERHVRTQPAPLPPLPQHLIESRRAPRGTVVIPVVPGRGDASNRLAEDFNAWAARTAEPPAEEQLPREALQDEPTLTELDAVPVVEATWPTPWEFTAAAPEPVEFEAPPPLMDFGPAVPSSEFETPPALLELGSAASVPEFDLPSEPNQVPEFHATSVHEPELTPEPAVPSAEKVPLLKREIHFRKPKAAKAPKAAKPPKAEKQPKAEKPQKAKSEPTEKVPLLKREIHIGRRRSAAAPKSAAPKSGSPKSGDGHKISRVVGLRIGSSQISAAHVRNNGSAEVVQLARKEIERGLIVAGEVREPIALAKELKAFFASNKLPRKDIRLGVASNRIGVRVLQVPAVDDAKQFENAIRFRAQESLPIPVADAVLDYVVLGEETSEEGELVRNVLLVFAHRDLVARYVDVCRQAGLRLVGIDLDAFALLRAVGPSQLDEGRRATVVVGIGHERTIFAVSDGEICDFARVLEWGSGAIDVALARALNLTPSQATPIKHALNLDATEPPVGLSPMQFEAARAAAKTEVGHLVHELLSSLRFYQSRPGSLDLGEIVLSGGGAQLTGLAAEVQAGLGASVRVADPFAHVKLAKRVAPSGDSGSLAIAVGLGIDS